MSFTAEQTARLQEKAAGILTGLRPGDGASAREALTQLYMTSLPDKDIRQGQLMADVFLQSVTVFDKDYGKVLEDASRDSGDSGFAAELSMRLDPEMIHTVHFRQQAGAALASVGSVPLPEAGERAADLLKLDEMADREKVRRADRAEAEKELQETLRKTLPLSGSLAFQLQQQKAALKQLCSGPTDDQSGALQFCVAALIPTAQPLFLQSLQSAVEMLDQEKISSLMKQPDLLFLPKKEQRAAAAMLLYTELKGGENGWSSWQLEQPYFLTAQQVTAVVCAWTVEAELLQSVAVGETGVSEAARRMQLLGMVVSAEFLESLVNCRLFSAEALYRSLLSFDSCCALTVELSRIFQQAVGAELKTELERAGKWELLLQTFQKARRNSVQQKHRTDAETLLSALERVSAAVDLTQMVSESQTCYKKICSLQTEQTAREQRQEQHETEPIKLE